MSTNKDYKIRFWFSASIMVVLGLMFIILSKALKDSFWGSVSGEVASALIVAGGFAILNDLFLKNKLVELILEKIKLKESIDRTGIVEIVGNISEIDYKFYLNRCHKNIDILHIYGRTWTNTNLELIKEKLVNTNCQVRVILLSPESKFIPALSETYCDDSFDVTPEDLKERIKEVTSMWRKLSKKLDKRGKRKTQSSIKLYYHKGQPTNSVYRIDEQIIIVNARTSTGKTIVLPSIICKNTNKSGDLYDIYLDEIEQVINEAEEINLIESEVS